MALVGRSLLSGLLMQSLRLLALMESASEVPFCFSGYDGGRPPVIVQNDYKIGSDVCLSGQRRIVPIRRSAIPFCQGEQGDIGRSRMPMPLLGP
jgi:hypothetical protein